MFKPLALVAAVLTAFSLNAFAKTELTVYTALEAEQLKTYKQAFEQANPGYRLQILWRQGFDALPFLRQPDQGGVDVYWAPSPGNFARLARDNGWQPLGVDLTGLPARIGGTALRDGGAHYQATELAGYGFAINPEVLARRIRAFDPFPGCTCQAGSELLKVLEKLPM